MSGIIYYYIRAESYFAGLFQESKKVIHPTTWKTQNVIVAVIYIDEKCM